MKLPLKLSRSRSITPPSSTPPSPAGSSTPSPTHSSQKKLLPTTNPRSPFPSLGKSPSSGKHEPSSAIVKIVASPTRAEGVEPLRNRGPSRSPASGKPVASSSMGKEKTTDTPSNLLEGVPSDLMRELKHVFAQFDRNGDGKISAEELRQVLRSLGEETSKEEAVRMVEEVDVDGDGYIDLEEFVGLNIRSLQVTGEMASQEELTAAFEIFDLDKNGWITAEELAAVLRRLGGVAAHNASLEDCRRMIRGVDRKGHGHVDFDDFKLMMMMSTNAFLLQEAS